MAGKVKLINVVLCIGLMAICITGCGAAEEGVGIGEAVETAEDVAGKDTDETSGDTASEQKNEMEIPADAEQTAMESTEEEITFEGLSLSILGDSISTFDKYIPEGFSVYYPFSGEVTDVSQTWWMKLLDDTGMELCSNDSSSGSTCVGDSLSIYDLKYACDGLRISFLTGKQGKMPDVIIVYLGTNDLLDNIPLGDNDGTKVVEEGMIDNFSDAYTLILDKLASEYPAAAIYCCTLPPIGDWGIDVPFVTFVNELNLTSEDYSEQIQIIARNKGVPILDLSNCGIEIDNLSEMTTDGVHFTPTGMEYIERTVLNDLKK